MTQPRKWLAECHAWLDDPTSVQFQNATGEWFTACENGWSPVDRQELPWRIKPKTLSINGREFECPIQPLNAVPDSKYFSMSCDGVLTLFWHSSVEARDLHYKILVEESTPK